MQQVVLRELCYNHKKIVFNRGENYIIGSPGTGKSTLFHLIQYILGIRKSLPRIVTPYNIDILSLDISFGNKSIQISRMFESDKIIINGDIQGEIIVSSSKIGDIYNELLQPNICNENDKITGIEILRTAFLGEAISDPLRESTKTLNKILGINIALPIQIKKEINNFEKEIELEEVTNQVLRNYINRIENIIKKNEFIHLKNEDIDNVVSILGKEFKTMRNESLQNMLLLDEAKESLNRANTYNEELFIDRTMIMDSYLSKLMSRFQVIVPVKIQDVFNNKLLSKKSLGETYLIKLLTSITLCRISEFDWHNSSGLLVNDANQGMLDRYALEQYRKIISDECRAGKLQYIEFGCDKKTIPHSAIILELNDRGV